MGARGSLKCRHSQISDPRKGCIRFAPDGVETQNNKLRLNKERDVKSRKTRVPAAMCDVRGAPHG